LELSIEETGAVIRCDQLPVITGIPLQMSQLFLNLFTNALKFTERRPEITISVQPALAEERVKFNFPLKETDYLRIAFTDNGIGFDTKYAERIFSIFQRLHTVEKYAGTGIGLALCKKIVDNHGGVISVESEPGQGTTFYLFFPFDKSLNEHHSFSFRQTGSAGSATVIR
ncbi:MAG TPA: ATP-binding protein, partial [Flavisolibacter sp.]|nr:ATP-binding protein [Flavisolibacter sp.]